MSDREQRGQSNRRRAQPSLRGALAAVLAFFQTLPEALAALGQGFAARIRRIVPRTKTVIRAHKERRFPESDRAFVQFFLFLFGMGRMWKARIRTALSRIRGTRLRRGRRAAHGAQHRLHPAVFICAALLIAAGASFVSLYTLGTTVSYKGSELDTVKDTDTARRITARVEGNIADTLQTAFAFEDDVLDYSVGLVQRSSVQPDDTLERDLTEEVGLITYGYSIYVDGELIGSTPYKGALEDLLTQITRQYVSDDTLTIDFVEDVEITEGSYVPSAQIVNLGRIAETLNSTKSGEVTYTVVKGDTWGAIAAAHEMSNDELAKLNPGYDINKIQIGDVLTISNAVPYLTTKVTERQNYRDTIPYETQYVDDSSMYQGDYRVISKGEAGEADVVANITYVNGVETEREIISSVTLSAPVTETQARGTKERPSWFPTGSFRWPASGRLTSGFGPRNTGIRGATTYHQGIDIACPYGTPIYAADGGTVEYTGYKGAMGYVVIINHGNGYKTYYEHCSSFTCSAGQHVYKGQQIARAGASGVASGSHCHFGIQKNGVYVNPLNYLP